MVRLTVFLVVCAVLPACTTMTKPDMTTESKARDRYECEQQAYAAAGGNALLLSNGLYRDCMRARGYK
jgi:hypothetical protein